MALPKLALQAADLHGTAETLRGHLGRRPPRGIGLLGGCKPDGFAGCRGLIDGCDQTHVLQALFAGRERHNIGPNGLGESVISLADWLLAGQRRCSSPLLMLSRRPICIVRLS